jgi:transglutaminase-like putative cysteine protease
MKRNFVIFITLGSLLLSSCFNQLTPDISSGEEQRHQSEKSGLNIKIFIPDYRKLAETGRAVAPQTAFIRLSVANGSGAYAQHGNLLTVNMNSLTPVAGAPSNLPGGIWNGTFTELDCKTYNAGSLKIELLNQERRVITQGVNQSNVTVTKTQAAQATFFTAPETLNSISGSLAAGEMRFWKVNMVQGYAYTLTVSAEGAYPDIVVFNNDGTFREYRQISTNARTALFNPTASGDCYMGVWADGAAVSSYSIALSYKFEDSREVFSAGFNGWTASASASAPPPVRVSENGKSILEFDSKPMYPGGRASLSRTVTFSVPTALSFNVKTDIGGAPVYTYFKLYIDNVEKASYDGLEASWKTGMLLIPAGSCEIKWALEKDSSAYYPTRTNKVWLADISFSPDVTAYVDVHPKGPKDTYVGGFAIPYTARALRSDSSIRSGISVAYSGAGVDPVTGLFTPPSTPGTYRVTASVDGKTASSDVITVHPADYLSKPHTYIATGKTYYGYEGGSGSMTVTGVTGVTFNRPAASTITADGFVTLEGEASSSRTVSVIKGDNSSLTTSYSLPAGRFSVRIWLRFGQGQYRITVNGQQAFNVTNTCTDTGADGGDPRFLYPSSVVQSDDFRITNLLTDLLYGVSGEADKIRIIHNYLVQNTIYDFDSINGTRKPQDALTVLGTRYSIDTRYTDGHYLAVCEGYSNAAAALLRAAGIETRIMTSTAMNHAWNHVFTDGSWKFMDVTWNDPTISGTGRDGGPYYVRYDYYLLTTMDGVNGDHYGDVINYTRSAAPVIPKMKGMPDGWY